MNKMKYLAIIGVIPMMLMGNSCEDTTPKNVQSQKAAEAAKSIQFSDNAEIDNIKKRIELTAQPGLVGYAVLLNAAGQPILYTTVKGKITSGGKRLTSPDRASSSWGTGNNTVVRTSPSDEGTWGSSGNYVYFWDVNGRYYQWGDGAYLYSDQPIRLSIQPLVVNVEEKK